MTVRDYYEILRTTGIGNEKILLNRHDVDSDIKTAKAFFEIETKHKVKATYYFRLSTLNEKFCREIEKFGSEASYHFEEIASFCKKKHIKTKAQAEANMELIREIFCNNFRMVEKVIGKKITTVCSHGDFVNRKLSLINNEITKSSLLRKELGINCETYDKDLINSFDIYVSDRKYPEFFSQSHVLDYIGKVKKIYLLTHPGNWRVNLRENIFNNLSRFMEECLW